MRHKIFSQWVGFFGDLGNARDADVVAVGKAKNVISAISEARGHQCTRLQG